MDYEELSGNKLNDTSEAIRQLVQAVYERQQIWFPNNGSTEILFNADMRVVEIRKFCQLQDEGQHLMRAAMSQLQLSARGYHRVLKLAHTIADLARSEEIQSAHLGGGAAISPKVHDGISQGQFIILIG